MKISNSSSRVFEHQKFKSENINAIEQGITKRLLKKYKPKHICNMESKLDKKNQKESGIRS